MNRVQSVVKNTGVLLLANIISKILDFFFVIYVARYLGAASFGILSFAFAFAGIFGLFTDLGLERLTIREVARDKSLAKIYLRNVAVMKAILVIISFGLIALAINLLGYPEQAIRVVYLVALSVIFTALTQIFYSIFQAFEKMEYLSVGQILRSILLLSGAFFAINRGLNVVGFAFLYFLVSIIIAGYSLAILRLKFANPSLVHAAWRTKIDLNFCKSTVRKALPFAFSTIFVTIYFQIDTVMLSLMKGDAVVGWYSAAHRLIFSLMLISGAFITSIFPTMSRDFKFARNSLKREYEIGFRYLLIIAIPILICGVIFADRVISIIYGIGYYPSIKALQVLVTLIPIVFLTSLFGNLLGAVDKQRVVATVAGANALLNVVLNMLLIPKLSYIGASIATVLTESMGFILMFGYISRYFIRIPIFKNVAKPIFAGFILTIIIYYFNQKSWILASFLGLSLYFGILYLTRAFPGNNITLTTLKS